MGTAGCKRRKEDLSAKPLVAKATGQAAANSSPESPRPRFENFTDVKCKTRYGDWRVGVIQHPCRNAFDKKGYLVLFGTDFCQFVLDDDSVCKRVGGTHWLHAVQDRDLAALKQSDLSLLDHKNQDRPALLASAENDWEEGLCWLISRKPWGFGPRVDPSGSDNVGCTALHSVVRNSRHTMLRTLLAAKANVNAEETAEDELYEDEAIEERRDWRDDILTRHLKPTHLVTPLHVAVTKEDTEACQVLLEFRADVNAMTFKDKTPLHLVEEQQPSEVQLALARLLLFHKADANLGNKARGEHSSLLEAVQQRNLNLVYLLLEMRAEVNATGGKKLGGMSALHLAARRKNATLVLRLLEARGDPTNVSWAGKTAAEIARSNKATSLADFLDGRLSESERDQFISDAIPDH